MLILYVPDNSRQKGSKPFVYQQIKSEIRLKRQGHIRHPGFQIFFFALLSRRLGFFDPYLLFFSPQSWSNQEVDEMAVNAVFIHFFLEHYDAKNRLT